MLSKPVVTRYHKPVKLFCVLLIILMCVSACTTFKHEPGSLAAIIETPDKPFASDGCTLAPDLDFRQCCEQHDRVYWCGGTREQRRRADQALKSCMRELGHEQLSGLYYAGVRLGGLPYLPTYWRWGFGWTGQHRYTHYARACVEKPGDHP